MQNSQSYRYAMRLAFHGSPFSGWQFQPEQKTVQGELNIALKSLLREDVKIVGAGRTDTGVHALNYVAHFDSSKIIDPVEIVSRLNRFLPNKISIYEIIKVNSTFHARFSAVSRAYSYSIRHRKFAFGNDMIWDYRRDMDYSLLHKCAASLLKAKDFSAFARSGSDNTNMICQIRHATWVQQDDNLTFQIKANRFSRNMVRSLVGTMVETANGHRNFSDWESLLLGGERAESGNSAPANGLIFMGVSYPKSPFNEREVAKY